MHYFLNWSTSKLKQESSVSPPFTIPNVSASPNTSNSAPITENSQPPRRKYPFLFLSALLLPIAVLPYFVMRRQMMPLRRKLEILEKDVQHLRNDLDVAVSNQESTGSELLHLRTTISIAMKEANALRDQANCLGVERIASNNSVEDIRRLLKGAQQSSDAQVSALHALGMSLAEVAAFMQEIERNLGLQTSHRDATQSQDQRGVERLRSLALRMQTLGHTSESN